jgi:hypothetical protein
MALDLWFRDDVMRIMASTHEATGASTAALPPASFEVADAYRQGFLDALRAVGIAFGIVPPVFTGQARTAHGAQIVDGESPSVDKNRRGQW